jgi:LmbE family N-acetylglucosaminyl deacetylase
MATLVCFHAHPDDESITTGGTITRSLRGIGPCWWSRTR